MILAEKDLPKTTERLSEEQVPLLMKALYEEIPQVRNLFILAIYTGMRKSELFRFKWEHIKWENAHVEIVPPKSKRANEKITITSGIRSILEDQLEVFKNSQFPDKDLGYVFYTPKGRCWKEKSRSIQTIYKRLRVKTGIKDFCMIHGLRNHLGSTHAAAGTPLPTLQSLLRHGSTSMTMRYITILDAEKREAAKQNENVFDRQGHNKK